VLGWLYLVRPGVQAALGAAGMEGRKIFRSCSSRLRWKVKGLSLVLGEQASAVGIDVWQVRTISARCSVPRGRDEGQWRWGLGQSRGQPLPPMASWKLSEPPSLRRPADYSKARQVFVTNQGWTRDLARSVNTCETMQGQKEASLTRYAGRPCENWPSSFILNKHYIMPRLFRSWESAQWTPY